MTKTKKDQDERIQDEQEIGLVRPMAITIKAAVVSTQSKKVLLLKRSKKELTNKNKWDLPGGHIEAGETVEEALKREIKQETGLDVQIGPLLQVTEFDKAHEAFKMEKRGLRFIVFSENEDVEIGKEHSDFVWLPIDEAIDKLSDEGFEKEKKEVLIATKERLDMEKATENWKRKVAEFENYKKRTVSDNENFQKFCLEGLILELLPVLDNFEMAADHIPDDQKESGWTSGIMHIKKQIYNILEAHGVNEFETKIGDDVDETKHEVISSTKKGGGSKVGKIIKKGYEMNGKIIRPASVEV